MTHNRHEDWHGEAGQTFVLLAAALPVILLAAALAIDVARMIEVRDELRVAVDGAALAGARALYDAAPTETKVRNSAHDVAGGDTVYGTGGGSTGRAVALTLNSSNASTGDIVLGTYDFAAKTFTAAAAPIDVTKINAVKVNGQLSRAASILPLGLGRLAGVTGFDAAQRAIAVLGGPSHRRPAFPMVISRTDFDGYVKSSSLSIPLTMVPGGTNAAWTGFFSGSSASTVAAYIKDPSTVPSIKRGDSLDTSNGTMDSAYHEAKKNYPAGSLITVPVVSFDPSITYGKVAGFTTFSIVKITDSGSQKAVIGTLIGNTTGTGGETLGDCFTLDCRPLLVN